MPSPPYDHLVRYLRMFTNAAAGGALGATYLTVLVLQLNPQVPEISTSALHWLMVLLSAYGLHFTIGMYLLMLIREATASRPLQPAWLSVRVLAWMSAVLAAAAALVTWANLKGFRGVMEVGAFERARAGATAITICAAVLIVIAIARYSFGRRGGPATAGVLAVAVALSVLVPAALRGPGDEGWTLPPARVPVPAIAPLPLAGEPTPIVRILALDGASMGFIRERVAAGRLPTFGRLLDRGGLIDLATIKPTQPDPVWAAAATGKYPPKNGVRSAGVYRAHAGDADAVDLLPDYCFAYSLLYLRLVHEQTATQASLRARPFWQILGDYGIAAGVVRWPLTFPARAERGYVISDRFHLGASSPLRLNDPQAGAPTSAVDIARESFDASQLRAERDAASGAAAAPPAPGGATAARWDAVYSDAAERLNEQFAPKVITLRYTGVDLMAHASLRSAEPGRFGVTASGRERYGNALDAYYGYIDEEIGRAISALGPGDLLLVVSGFGMEPEGLAKQWLAEILGRPVQSGTHEAAPDGFLLAYGSNVAQGQRPRGAVVDLAPTILYYLGVPIGRDMDGFARADLFTPAFNAQHFITFIASHER